jgi:hypothetical protein
MFVEPIRLPKKIALMLLVNHSIRRLSVFSALLLLGGAVFASFCWLKPAAARGFDSPRVAEPAAPAPASPVQSEKVVTILRSSGFEPDAVTRTGGQFTLVVANRSGMNELRFLLKRSTGEQVREITVAPGTLEIKEPVDIPAGTYYLVEATHPSWVFHLTIQ